MDRDGSPAPRNQDTTLLATLESLSKDTFTDMMSTTTTKRSNTSMYQNASTHSESIMRDGKAPLIARSMSSKKIDSSSVVARQTLDAIETPASSTPVAMLLAKALQQQSLDKSKDSMKSLEIETQGLTIRESDTSSSGSIPVTPGSDKQNDFALSGSQGSISASVGSTEVLRLRKELEDAKTKIARMDQELHQSRIAGHTLHQIGTPSEADYQQNNGLIEQPICNLNNVLNISNRTGSPQDNWPLPDESRSDSKTALPIESFGIKNDIWTNGTRSTFLHENPVTTEAQLPTSTTQWPSSGLKSAFGPNITPTINPQAFVPLQPQQAPSNKNIRLNYYSSDRQHLSELTSFPVDQLLRRSISPQATSASPTGSSYGTWGPYTNAQSPPESMAMSPPMDAIQMEAALISNGALPYPLPFAPRVPTPNSNYMNGYSWGGQPTQTESNEAMYMAPASMNYRQLLDKNLDCNWKLIVDKIVNQNDQQASIFLQQKLKIANPRQKYSIVEAIVAQAFSLMTNRFGNFLVQRCFEHGTPEQVIAIANEIRGKTLQLSMDPFGCHVIQKAFDCVPEEYKAIMVHELLLRIPETVIHRYACHVWQKLFELRWKNSPPQIMRYVNEALRGMWHEVALGETGSLVVQNIFENCLEDDKRPCINEVLASIDVIAHGQFGNWCIQHICEHGAPADRKRAIDHILRFAMEYSTDQYASKVIEKCLKIGGKDFLDRYLERICEAHPDRPRMPLIDIAGDQFGNYLIQYILLHCGPHYRDIVANHVRKHMVSLRGSKYGSRVAMLCCNPAVSTRPGPPPGMQLGSRFAGSNSTNSITSTRNVYGGAYRA